MKWRCENREPRSIADHQSEEPIVEWRDVFRGSRVSHRFYPHQYARVLVAKGVRHGWSHDD